MILHTDSSPPLSNTRGNPRFKQVSIDSQSDISKAIILR